MQDEAEHSPRARAHVFGHSETEARFLSDISQNRLHHAYLLCGPKGIGKATFAYRLARYLLNKDAVKAAPALQEAPPAMGLFGAMDLPKEPASPQLPETELTGLDIDPGSALFRRVAQGSHTDLMTLSPAFDAKKQVEKTDIKVDQARKVAEFLALTPAESAYRVVVIDAVDALNIQASNALLKTLEEPPANSILMLVCHRPAKLLPTIISRCQKVVMRPLSLDDFSKVLQEVVPEIPAGQLPQLFALSQGSPGQAIMLHRYKGAEIYQKLLEAIRPSASLQVRQKFAEFAHGIKDAAHWQLVIDLWRTLVFRMMLPMAALTNPLTGELETLAQLQQEQTPESLGRFLDRVEQILRDTEIFHLERRQTALLMVSPKQVLKQQAA